MRTRGMKTCDPLLGSVQIDWLVVPVGECPDDDAEGRLIRTHFRKVHEPWEPAGAFVLPVRISRSRRRVLFRQESGLLEVS
ncbi:MAG TPA: hypothetical protein VMY42_28115 [Thermoguttaceae bacterium]|nr:hypothetical protein [Thermoguttaceae bacterium]